MLYLKIFFIVNFVVVAKETIIFKFLRFYGSKPKDLISYFCFNIIVIRGLISLLIISLKCRWVTENAKSLFLFV